MKLESNLRSHSGVLHAAPVTTPVGRLDEGRAVKDPVLCYTCSG